MPDLVQIADDLKNMPDQWLAMQAQQPTGVVPPYLVIAEIQRREKLRSGASRAQAPASSVTEDLIRSMQARMPPSPGLPPGSVPPQATPPGMPPPNLSGGNSGLGTPAPGTPPANMRMPQGMAFGGSVDDDDDENYDDSENQEDQPPAPADFLQRLYRRQIEGSPLAQITPPMANPRYFDPRFEPMATPAPGSAGKNIWGELNPVQPVPASRISNVAPLFREEEALEARLGEKPEDFTDPAHVAKYKQAAREFLGDQDTNAWSREAEYLRQQAAKAQPTWQGALMRWGANVAASPAQHWWMALGPAQQKTLEWSDAQKEKARQLELARLQLDAQVQQQGNQYKQHMGTVGMNLQQNAIRQEQLNRTTLNNRLYKVRDEIQRERDRALAANDAYQKQLAKDFETSQKQFLTVPAALAALNDPVHGAAARKFLDSEANWKREQQGLDNDQKAAWEQRKFDYQEKRRLENQTALENLRHENSMARLDKTLQSRYGIGGTNRKLTNPAAIDTADYLRQEQLNMMARNKNGELVAAKGSRAGMPLYDEKGVEIPNEEGEVVLDSAGNPIKTPAQFWVEASRRAYKNLINPDNYADHPLLGESGNRTLVLGALGRPVPAAVAKSVKMPFAIGGGRGIAQPKPQAAPTPAPVPERKPSPSGAPGVPAEIQDLAEGKIRKDLQGSMWYHDPKTHQVRRLRPGEAIE
jgi:hypothetical protein